MNLINFPMDKQKCHLNIEACKSTSFYLQILFDGSGNENSELHTSA